MKRTSGFVLCGLFFVAGICGWSFAQQTTNAPAGPQAQAPSSGGAKTPSKSSEVKKKEPKKKASKNTAAPKKGPGKPEQTRDQ